MIPTFHILIATAGRPSLKWMLHSLRDELSDKDAITIVFDGDKAKGKSGFSEAWLKGHSSDITIIEKSRILGYWGHEIRNKYQGSLNPVTSFIMHADDDDIYIKGTFNRLRNDCLNPHTLYIGTMCNNDGICWPKLNSNKIEFSNIGTPCGIIPYSIADKGVWLRETGGDYYYYKFLSHFVKDIVFLGGKAIYKIRPTETDLMKFNDY